MTDAQGRTVDFKNTVIIMTSNLGTADLRKTSVGFAKTDEAVTHEKMRTKVNDALKQHFRPEFLNRIDDVIVFHELSKDEVTEIIDLMIQRVRGQLEAQGLSIELTRAAKYLVVEKGYDPTMGARPLRRALQRMVEDPLSERILLEGVPGRRHHHRRRRQRRGHLPGHGALRAAAGRVGRRRQQRLAHAGLPRGNGSRAPGLALPPSRPSVKRWPEPPRNGAPPRRVVGPAPPHRG